MTGSNNYIAEAEICFNNKDYSNARINLHRVLAANLNDDHSRYLLAECAAKLFLHREAIFNFKKLIDKNYGILHSHWLSLYNIYNDLCNFSQAVYSLNESKKNGLSDDMYEKYIFEICYKAIRYVHEYNLSRDYTKASEISSEMIKVLPQKYKKYCNAFLSEKELADKKIILESKPRVITAVLTTKCNVKCLMCDLHKKKQYELPEKTKDELLKAIPYLERIVLLGGEIFLYSHFEEIIDVAMKYPVNIDIITNGTLLTPNIVEKLVQCNGDIAISVDGTTKEIHERIRKGIDFDKVVENIKLINEMRKKYNSKITLKLYVTIMKSNYRQLEDFIEFAHDYSFDFIFINSVNYRNSDEDIFYTNFIPEAIEFISDKKSIVAEKAKKYNITLMETLPDKRMYLEWLRPLMEQYLKEGKNTEIIKKYLEYINKDTATTARQEQQDGSVKKEINCYVPWRKLYLDFDGTIRPDCYCWNHFGDNRNVIGNVMENSIEEIWNSEAMQNYRRKILECNNDSICSNECLCGKVPDHNLRKIY